MLKDGLNTRCVQSMDRRREVGVTVVGPGQMGLDRGPGHGLERLIRGVIE